MPLQPKQLSAQEMLVARQAAQPVVSFVLDRLLRGGAACYIEFERKLLKVCEEACTTHRFTGADGRTRFEREKYVRVNPEDLKQVLRSCGVLLDTEQFKLIRVAYSDPVGFVLSDPLLSALCPLGHVPAGLARTLLSALPPPQKEFPHHQQRDQDGDGFTSLPDVRLDGVLSALASVFASGRDADRADSTFQQDAYEGALRCFSAEVYPDQRVPGLSFANFIAAEVLLLYTNTAVDDAAFTSIVAGLEDRLAACADQLEAVPPTPAQVKGTLSATSSRGGGRTNSVATAGLPSAAAIAAATVNKDKTSSIVDFSMTHTNVPRRPRKFEYYMQHDDRRDEWLRGRQEKDARGMYGRHTVGYGGHLPEYQYHFGRTFHVIEEDLPDLTRPKPPREAPAPDTFGPGKVLGANRMTAHHFTFA